MVTTIEAPFTLFKEQKETILRDTVEPAEMALGLVPEVFNPVDMVLTSDKTVRMIDPNMIKIRDVQGIVACKAVSVHDTVGGNHLLDDRHQGGGLGVGYHHRNHAASPLKQTKNRHFPRRAPATLPFPDSTEIALVDFDLASERRGFSHLDGNKPSQAGEKRSRGIAMYSHDLGGGSGRSPSNKKLNQAATFMDAQSTLSRIHVLILSLNSSLS